MSIDKEMKKDKTYLATVMKIAICFVDKLLFVMLNLVSNVGGVETEILNAASEIISCVYKIAQVARQTSNVQVKVEVQPVKITSKFMLHHYSVYTKDQFFAPSRNEHIVPQIIVQQTSSRNRI